MNRLTYEFDGGATVTVYPMREAHIPWSIHVPGVGVDEGEYQPQTGTSNTSLDHSLHILLTLMDQAIQSEGTQDALGLHNTADALRPLGSEVRAAWDTFMR